MMTRTSRIKTLYLDANGSGPQIIWIDTVLRGMFRRRDGDLPPFPLDRIRKVRSWFRGLRDFYAPLSYIADWRDAFVHHPRLDVEVCNINNLVHLGRCLATIGRYDLIVVSHAATGDDMTLMRRFERRFTRRRGKMAVFIGNEYSLMGDKISFLRNTGPDFICTQLPLDAAQYLYGDIPGTLIHPMPHALNPAVYRPPPHENRDIGIGFIGDLYWPFVGDEERTRLIRAVEGRAPRSGIAVDFRFKRVDRAEWTRFLGRCQGIVGAESGTYYLNGQGAALEEARQYNIAHPDATFDDIFQRFFAGLTPVVSGKAVSSRHFEPIGTGTCQILMRGGYNGVLTADQHYIGVARDLSDLDQALARFADPDERRRVAEAALEHVMGHHTHRHRVDSLLGLL